MAKSSKPPIDEPVASSESNFGSELDELKAVLGGNFPASDKCISIALERAKKIASLSTTMQIAILVLGSVAIDAVCSSSD